MKIAISVPDPVFQAAERFAKERGMPRSQLIAEALKEYLDHHGPEAITAQIDRVYDGENSELDESFIRAQSSVMKDEAW
ncbi:MAG: ribbon-helix-helix protein, CopG family [Wenzhouxiangella sp.]|nr:ribbon-helix-helix protein, CopG family [Wenzhouxiangella sp.]